VRVRGAERDAAAIPIVVAHGKPSKAQVHQARTTVVCETRIARVAFVAAASTGNADGGAGAAASKLGSIAKRVADPVVRAAGAVVDKAKGAGAALGNPDQRLDDPFVLVILVLLVSALSGGLLLAAQVARAAGLFDR
jgi:hypothetical protein